MSLTRRQVFTSLFRSKDSTPELSVKVRGEARLHSDEAWATLLESGKSLYARDKEEPLIRHFFRDRRGGVFVDAGCFLPEKNSATCYLERHLEWTGLGIDAQDLSEDWKQTRSRSRFVEAVLSEAPNQPVTLFLAAGSTTLLPERLDEAAYPWQRRPVERITSTLNDVLENAHIPSFDFLSISVNGVERGVLAGLDLERYRPQLIRILCGPGQRLPTIESLSAAGYGLIKDYRAFDPLNRYFTPEP